MRGCIACSSPGPSAVAAERLRILHTESSLGWGGQEIRVLTEARGVARRGHEVTLAAPGESRIFQAAPAYGLEALAVPIARKSIRGLRGMVLIHARPCSTARSRKGRRERKPWTINSRPNRYAEVLEEQ